MIILIGWVRVPGQALIIPADGELPGPGYRIAIPGNRVTVAIGDGILRYASEMGQTYCYLWCNKILFFLAHSCV